MFGVFAAIRDALRRRRRRKHLRNLVRLSEQYGLYDYDFQAMTALKEQGDK
jgi:hypothetical protein